jgi:23S rRNA (adenine2503-C2)-methyltransferase
MHFEEIGQEFQKFGYKPYHALQIFKWLHKGILSFDEMTDISKSLREELNKSYQILPADIIKKFSSKKDETARYVLKLHDEKLVESVLMKYHHGYTVCISTQVGCKMNCAFCATGKLGFTRDLTASEMLSQIHAVQKDLGFRISNVVLMGMGEPLDNYSNTVRFLKLATAQKGLNIGMRHISLSTCGLVDKIYDLADENLGATLSVSLHSPNNDLRNQILPINKKFPVEQLLEACKDYAKKTKRRITYEYTMINNFNDSDFCAKELANKIKGTLCHVNLIPVNKTEGNNLKKSQMGRIESFARILLDRGVSVTTRRNLGEDINASCGQLTAKLS